MVQKEDRRLVMDCKVIPGEEVVTQHRVLVVDLRMKIERKRRKEKKIKVWEHRDEKKTSLKPKFKELSGKNIKMAGFQKR